MQVTQRTRTEELAANPRSINGPIAQNIKVLEQTLEDLDREYKALWERLPGLEHKSAGLREELAQHQSQVCPSFPSPLPPYFTLSSFLVSHAAILSSARAVAGQCGH